MPLVEIEDLYISFGVRPAVDGVSLTINAGERVGLIGESGSGKSLTALALTGLLPEGASMQGAIRFAGAPLPAGEADMARLRGNRIGMVFQEPMTALNPLMRAGDQIGEAVALHFPRRGVKEHVAALLKEVGLTTEHGRRYPHQLSGGQRQRVMIAMALAAEPELMICDEPTSALDLITQRRILSLIDRICGERNMAVLFISHDLRAVAALCARVCVLQSGKQVESGPLSSMLSAPKSAYAQALVASARLSISPLTDKTSFAPLFEAHSLTRSFASPGLPFMKRGAPVVAVNAVSFAIGAGEAVALVGPSGCGKTTLARLVTGLDMPDAGEMSLEGRSYGAQQHLPAQLRRDVSLVFQDPYGSFDPHLRVGASVAEPLRLIPRLSPTERLERLHDAVEAVGLNVDMLGRYPHAFSGGQRQRLAIARALITRPRLVVLDEPVSALDVSLRADILELLNRLRAEFGLAYLMISHDLDMVRSVTDRILVMSKGRLVETGSPEDIFTHPRHEMTRQLLDARLPAPA